MTRAMATAFAVGLLLTGEAHADAGWALRGAVERAAAADGSPVGGRTVPAQPGRNAVMVFGGPAVSARLGEIAVGHLPDGIKPVAFVGVAASREVARWRGFSIELEGGFGGQIARHRHPDAFLNSTPQAWAAAFVRYDRFPWNHRLRTTIAASVGANYAHRRTPLEHHGREGRTKHLLHYLAPEITFARPGAPEREIVFRLHHRSAAFGLFGCGSCASNVLTAGLRRRF